MSDPYDGTISLSGGDSRSDVDTVDDRDHALPEATPVDNAGAPGPNDLEEVWARAVTGLSDGQLSPQHRAWVGLTRPLGLMEDTVLLAAPNEFAKDVLDSRLRPVIAGALSAAFGREIRVAVTVQPQPVDEAAAEAAQQDRSYDQLGASEDRGTTDDPFDNVRTLPGADRARPAPDSDTGMRRSGGGG
ncbi:MAG: hypothetical protein ABIO67_04135, partial [Mycobacteriales bacterium]